MGPPGGNLIHETRFLQKSHPKDEHELRTAYEYENTLFFQPATFGPAFVL